MHHNTKFGNKCSVVWKISSGQTLTFWPFTVTLTLNEVIHFFSQGTLAYYDASSDQVWLPRNQRFIRYNRKSHILITWSLTVTFTLKIANNLFFFLCDTHDAASPYQVWLQNLLRFRRYHPNKHSLTFWTSAVALTLNTVTQFLHRTHWLMMLYYQTKFGCKRTSCLEDRVEIVIFWLYKPLLWPWHWRQLSHFSARPSGSWCCITKFGIKMTCSLEDIIWTNIY